MLDKKDIELLEKAKQDGKTLDEIIKSAKNIVALNNLQKHLIQIRNEILYKSDFVIKYKILEISKLKDSGKMLDFIVKESFKLYKKEQEEIEKQKLEEQKLEEQE